MRFLEIQMDGFGHFQNQSIGHLSKGLTIIEGSNEAGKSTLLAFIRAVLFGLEKSEIHQYEPLQGNVFAGRIKLSDQEGNIYTLERKFGRKERVTVYLPDGTRGDQSFLPVLTGPMQGNVYKNIFAFGLGELERFESLHQEEIHERIYSTGMGLGSLSLTSITHHLESEMEKRFKPRGSTQVIASSLRALKEIQQKIKGKQNESELYNRLQQELASIEAQFIQLEEQRQFLKEQIGKGKVLLELRNGWMERNQMVSRFSHLPNVESFPADGKIRLEQVEQRLEELRREELQIKEELADWQKHWDQLGEPSVLLTVKGEYIRLRSMAESFFADLKERSSKEQTLHSLRDSLEEQMNKLGNLCSEDLLESFDISVQRREWIRNQENQLHEATREFQEMEDRFKRVKEELEDIKDEYEEKVREIQSIEASLSLRTDQLAAREQWSHKVNELYQDITFLQREEERLIRVKEEQEEIVSLLARQRHEDKSSLHWLGVALLLVGSFSFIFSWILASPMLTGLSGGVLMGGTVVLLISRRNGKREGFRKNGNDPLNHEKMQKEIERVRKDLREKRKEAEKYSLLLKGKESLTKGEMDDLQQEIKDLRAKMESLRWKADTLHDLAVKKSQVEKRFCSLQDEMEKKRSMKEKQIQAWNQWLMSQGLPEGLSALSVLEVFHVIERVQQIRKQIQTQEEEKSLLDERIRETRRALQDFLTRIGRNHCQEGTERDVFQQLEEEFIQANATEEKRDHFIQTREKLEKRRNVWKQQWNDQLAKRGKLFALAGVEDEESFRARAQAFEEKRSLENQLAIIDTRLEAIAGTKDRLQELMPLCKEKDKGTLETQIALWEQELEEIRLRVSKLHQRKGELKQQQEGLENSCELADLRLQGQQLRTIVNAEAQQWAVFAMAKWLLQEAKERYEREKQPSVLRKASDMFQIMTQGRFRKIWSPLGEQQKIDVETSQGHRLDLKKLSRGTGEQLYLSMRFALIREMAAQGMIMPIVMDDIFVNFDPQRFRATVAALCELVSSHQILFFTCHPHMASLLKEEIPDTTHLRLTPHAIMQPSEA